MAFFDIANFEVSESVARLLGFKRIFAIGKEIGERPGNASFILHADAEVSLGYVKKHVSSPFAIGLACGFGTRIAESALSFLAEREKALILDTSSVFSSREQLPQLLRHARWIYAHARHARVNIAIATFAKSRQELLSAQQLIGIASVLGANGKGAEEMLSQLGKVIA